MRDSLAMVVYRMVVHTGEGAVAAVEREEALHPRPLPALPEGMRATGGLCAPINPSMSQEFHLWLPTLIFWVMYLQTRLEIIKPERLEKSWYVLLWAHSPTCAD